MKTSRSVRNARLQLVAGFAALAAVAGCDSEADIQPEDFVDTDPAASNSDDIGDDVEFRWSTPLPGVETMVTSMNTPSTGQNPGCWDTSPSGSPRTFQQYPCHARDNQRWVFETVGSFFRIHSADDDDLCVDVPNSNMTSGQDLQLFPCHSGANQLWGLASVDGQSASIRPALDDTLCMNVENAIVTGQSRIQIYTCTDAINERWRFHDYLDDDTIGGCSGSVRFYSTQHAPSSVVGPGGVGNYPVTTNKPDTLCSSDFDHELVNCPSGTDWIVADRLGGTGSFKVRCFDTK